MKAVSILYWRDIPSQIIAGRGRKAAKVMLADRFQEAIDMAAMRSKAHGTDAYLAGWRRGAPAEISGDLTIEVSGLKLKIETEYDERRLETLTKSGGWTDGKERGYA